MIKKDGLKVTVTGYTDKTGDVAKVGCATCHQGLNKPMNGAQMLKDFVAELGKKGRVSLLMRELGGMSPEHRTVAGPALNGLKDRLTSAINARKAELELAALNIRLEAEREDLTLPPRYEPVGALHPVMQVFEELAAIFADMGFAVAEGPQVESDWYNFDALNIPPEHPARQEHDTFFMHRATGDARPLR